MKNAGIPDKPVHILYKHAVYLIIVAALILRLPGLNFGLPFIYHPDEFHFVNPALRILSTQDLNPHWFGNPGSFIMYLLAIWFGMILGVYGIYSFLAGQIHNLSEFRFLVRNNPVFFLYNNPVFFYLTGRLLMVLFAVITVYVTYLTAKRIFNKPIGLLAAFSLAICPLHIENSRHIRADVAATMLIMLSMYFLMKSFEQNENKNSLPASSFLAGVAIACKYPSGIIIFPLLFYSFVSDLKLCGNVPAKCSVNFFKIKTHLSRVLLSVFIGFVIFAPFVLLDFRKAIKDIIYELRPTHLGAERLPGLQNHIWYLKNVLTEGAGGIFFAIFAALGLCIALLKKSYKQYLFLLFPLLYYAVIVGWAKLRWARWLIPVLPFEAIFFGFGFYAGYKYCLKKIISRPLQVTATLLLSATLIGASIPVIMKDAKEAIKLCKPDTRTLAKDWIEKNLPAGSKIAYEYFSPHLGVNPRQDFVLMDMDWKKIVSQPLSYYRNHNVDYIIVTGWFKDAYYGEPHKYNKEILRYEDLRANADLIKFFDNRENGGPKIELYGLK